MYIKYIELLAFWGRIDCIMMSLSSAAECRMMTATKNPESHEAIERSFAEHG